LLGLKLSESLKDSDFRTLYLGSKEQNRGFQLLIQLAPSMSESLKDRVRTVAKQVAVEPAEFAQMTHTARSQFAEYKVRRGLEPLRIEEAQIAYSVTERMQSKDKPEKAAVRPLYASASDVPQYVTELGLAWQ